MPRLRDLQEFYKLLGLLAEHIGGTRRLETCTGRMSWPKHGVYFFFERGEPRSDTGLGDRVVRVGTHALTETSKTTLWHRLSQHRGTQSTSGGNHRGSIFRLLVGEALGRREPALALSSWGTGQTAAGENRMSEHVHEMRVSRYLGDMSIVWLPVPTDERGRLAGAYVERNAIALLSNYDRPPLDAASTEWLGRFSDRPRVRLSGLWNQNHVEETHDPAFLDQFARHVEVVG